MTHIAPAPALGRPDGAVYVTNSGVTAGASQVLVIMP